MIKIPIGKDADGNTVCINIIQLDRRFGPNNKKIAAIQTEIIKEARAKLAKRNGARAF